MTPVTVNIYDGCCPDPCGDKAGAGGGTGGEIPGFPGGTAPADYGNIVTLCDFITTAVPETIVRVGQVIDIVQNGTFFTEFVEITPVIGDLIDSVGDSATQIEAELDDPDTLRSVREAAIKAFADPVGTLTRDDLFDFALKVPFLIGGAPMKSAYSLWASVANVNDFNEWVRRNVPGTGDYEGICQEFSLSSNRPLLPNQSQTVGFVDFVNPCQQYGFDEFQSNWYVPTTDPGWILVGGVPPNVRQTRYTGGTGFTYTGGSAGRPAGLGMIAEFEEPVLITRVSGAHANKNDGEDQNPVTQVNLNIRATNGGEQTWLTGSPVAGPSDGTNRTFVFNAPQGGILADKVQITMFEGAGDPDFGQLVINLLTIECEL